MARIKDREKAIKLRREGATYSQIKQRLGTSKSTLSAWLHNYPLSKERLVRVRDKNPKRIENFRNTMRAKRENRISKVYCIAKKDIGKITAREEFVAGLFLYWAEGTKASPYETSIANSDPALLRFFILWLEKIGVKKSRLNIRLYLYSNMNITSEVKYWKKQLDVPQKCFRTPIIKKTQPGRIYHKGMFEHGTCNVRFYNRDVHEYTLMSLKYVRECYD